MYSLRRSLLVLIPVLALLGACGGGDDDDDDANDGGDDPAGASSPANTSGAGSGSSNGNADIPAIKDGAFSDGDVHVEVTGDKDFTLDLKGNAFAASGFAQLTFASEEAMVSLSFQGDSEEDPGAITLTTEEISTAAEWGTDCTVTMEDGENELKGEFTCNEVEGIQPGTVNTYKVRISGNFSVTR